LQNEPQPEGVQMSVKGAPKMHRVLVTGAGGYIGSHMCKMLREAGHYVVALDTLENGFRDAITADAVVIGSVAERDLVRAAVLEHQVGSVIHFAGYIQVGESVKDPLKYYQNNVSNSLVLLDTLLAAEVKTFIFSSTAAIFGNPQYTPIDEKHPKAPINPYGHSKLFVEQICQNLSASSGLKYVCLRYFNAAGAHPDGSIGERHEPETHLIPLAIDAALGVRPALQVFGNDYDTRDGTCIRDYVHVHDLCMAHLASLNYLSHGGASTQFNLGTGTGNTVLEVLHTIESELKMPVPRNFSGRRAGDPAQLVADPTVAMRVLGWSRQFELQDIVRHAVKWHTTMKRVNVDAVTANLRLLP
jgi:UDP-glucose 4-epimerase